MAESVMVRVEPERITRNGKRFFSKAHKRAVVEKCLAPGASVAAVALAHELNANLVRKWIDKHLGCRSGPSARVVAVAAEQPRREAAQSRAATGKSKASATTVRLPEGVIEIEIGNARLTLRGVVQREPLQLVLDSLMRAR